MADIEFVYPLVPIAKTEDELKQIIADELSKILGSNIHSEVFDRRVDMRALEQERALETNDGWYELAFTEIESNIHLWERLGTAYEALKALKGYVGQPRGFIKVES